MKGPANKANLVARCVDGELFGAIPCPRCVTGKLKVAYASPDAHGGQGDWTCRGSFDESIGIRTKCYFTARPGEVTRLPWRDLHDPRPSPKARRAQGRVHRRRQVPAGFESFEARPPPSPSRTSPPSSASSSRRRTSTRRSARSSNATKNRDSGTGRDAAGAPRDVSAADRRGGRRRSPRSIGQ